MIASVLFIAMTLFVTMVVFILAILHYRDLVRMILVSIGGIVATVLQTVFLFYFPFLS